MTRKEAFLRKGEIAFKFFTTSLYNRSKATRWYEDYNANQMMSLGMCRNTL